MRVQFLDLKKQYLSIQKEIDTAIQAVIYESAFVKGAHVERFEKNFAEYIGTNHCIGVGNGTDALFIALKCLSIGAGDEVIVPANSFIATSEAVTFTGAKPIFVDCNEHYNIDPQKVEAAITQKTKAIIPVHLYGQPADMDGIMRIANSRGLMVIEDAAQAHGAEYRGKRVGTFGIAAIFSFYPGKNLGAYGDGGAIVTSDNKLAEKIRMYANHGRAGKYDHEFEGVNSRLDGIQAAILDVKLKHLDRWTKHRVAVAKAYDAALADIVQIPKVLPDVKHVYHLYVIQISERDKLRNYFSEAGIETGIHYPAALPFLAAYQKRGYKPEDFPTAHRAAGKILSLPIHEQLTDEEQEHIVSAARKFMETTS